MMKFRRLVEVGGFDILHAHGRSTGAFVGLAKLMGGVKGAMVLHDHYGGVRYNGQVPLAFRAIVLRAISCYVGASSDLAAWAAAAGVLPDRCFCILNAVSTEDFADLSGGACSDASLGREKRTVGVCLAGLRREKGILELIHAVSRIAGEEFEIVVAGGIRDVHYVSACGNAILDLGIASKIRLIGEVEDGKAVLRHADFVVIPSLWESGPLVLIEAMLAGLPFVCTRTGGVAEAAASVGLERFVAPGDVEGLADGIQELVVMSGEERRERGKKGRLFAEAHFDIRDRVAEWIMVYERALEMSK
jgi:glycosyltransferase involved in cell wall biosynthesis